MKNKKIKTRYPSYSQLIGINHSYSPRSSPPHVKRDIPPRLPTKKQRSQSLTPNQPIHPGQAMTACSTLRNFSEKYNSADGVVLGKYDFHLHFGIHYFHFFTNNMDSIYREKW